MTIEALRTPEERFDGLPDYPFTPHWFDQPGGLRMHYLDEGAGDTTFLCLHGQPSWSYLYRKMIPVLARAGRVIAPDLIGFGKSDKPVDDTRYTFDFHRQSLVELIHHLDLQNVTLVCQDWGGLLGLTIPPFMAERFDRLIVMNTGFATGEAPLGPGFLAWKAFNAAHPDMDIQMLFQRGTPILSEAEAAAYAAPYPDIRYKAGVRRFPELVPDNPHAGGAHISRAARDWWRDAWAGQSFMAVGAADPVIGVEAMAGLRRNIRNCPEPLVIAEAGHFVQEWGVEVAKAALASFAETP
jgi:haloalkane dehalogenase